MIFQPFAIISQAPFDPDAQAYITAVEAADGQALEDSIRIAINNFVVGCKADGIWDAIKASCILAGARTLSGSLTPLKGTAPTNFNFVSGDYNRKTGLVGDGSTKYLDSNRNNNADPQDSKHIAVHASIVSTTDNRSYLGMAASSGSTHLSVGTQNVFLGARLNSSTGALTNASNTAGFLGINRGSSTAFVARGGGATTGNISNSSTTPASGNLLIFNGLNIINARLAFYSIGENINLAQLDTRVTNLINAIDAAI
jgi:hypothetical protein